jgi:hypothetical protein
MPEIPLKMLVRTGVGAARQGDIRASGRLTAKQIEDSNANGK